MDKHLPAEDIRHRSFLARQSSSSSKRPHSNLSFCKDALVRVGTKPQIFRELRQNLEVLNEQDLEAFLANIDTSSLASQVLVLKASRLRASAVKPSSLLLQASTALKIYNLAQSSSTDSPECAIIAALSLVQASFWAESNTQQFLLRAAAILELARVRHEDYFPFAVFLISLYRYLGLFSLAFATFVSLSVKNLQWETVGHLILTRVGTLHPQRGEDEVKDNGKTESGFEPAGALDSTLRVSDKILNGIGESVKRGLREGSYDNVINAVETKRKIDHGVWRRVCTIEEQKVARMTGDTTIEAWHEHKLKSGESLSDQRDTTFMPVYSKVDSAVWDELLCGPQPKEGWLQVMAFQERLLSCLRYRAGDRELAAKEWEALQAAQQQVGASLPDESAFKTQLTTPEQHEYAVCRHIYEIAMALRSGTTPSDEAFAATERMLSDWSSQAPTLTSADTIGIGWQQLHHWYIGLELVHLLSVFAKWAAESGASPAVSGAGGKGKKGKAASSTNAAQGSISSIPKAKVQRLVDAAEQMGVQIREQARKRKGRFAEGGVLGSVLEGVLPGEEAGEEEGQFAEHFGAFVDAAGGEAAVETVAGRWLSSWEDGCDGVLGVNLPVLKGK